jgi:NADH-quinone oxidoreductase subunit E
MAVFIAELRAQAEEIKSRYPDPRSALLPMLYMVQSVEGYVTREGMQEIAEILNITTSQVEAVATFYTMFHMEPVGEHLIAVCTNVSCMLRGAYDVLEVAQDALGEGHEGHTSADGVFTVHEEECLGACDAAPVVQVNVANHDCVSKERMAEIIQQLRAGQMPSPARGEAPASWKQAAKILAGLGDGA